MTTMQGLGRSFLETAQRTLARLGLASGVAHVDSAGLGPGAWEMGELRGLSVLEPDATAAQFRRLGSTTLFDLESLGIRLWVSASGDKLHLVGGRQQLLLSALGLSAAGSGPVLIGPVDRLRYISTRSGEHVEYEHLAGYAFGSDYSELPVLVYDPAERRLELVGGVYRVGRSMGVVN